MRVTSEIRHKSLAGLRIALLSLAAVFAGCSYDRDAFEPSDEKDGVTFSLTIPFSSDATRADKQGHEEVDSDFYTFEDFINPNDIGVFVFLGEEEDAPLVNMWTLLAQSKNPNTSMTGYGSHYVITLRMTRDELVKVRPDIHIGPNSSDIIKFRVVTLANENFKKAGENNYSDYNGCKTYKALVDKAYSKELSLGTKFYPNGGPLDSSIPMFGMCLFEIRADDLYYTRPDEVIDLGDIYMLRCLAKVRFVDNTTKKGLYPRISCDRNTHPKAGLNYIYRKAYNLPFDALRYQNGYQMDNIHLCTSSQYTGNVDNIKSTDKTDPKVLYSSYCPEQRIGSYSSTLYPNLTFYYKRTADHYWESYTVVLEGTQLPDGSYGLIRNHIYTIEVTNDTTRSGEDTGPQIKVTDRTW